MTARVVDLYPETAPQTGPHPWHWQAQDMMGAATVWAELSAWVAAIVERYQLGDTIPACWYAHGAIVEELTALWAAWKAAYTEPDANPGQPLAWHEQFAAARRRIAEWDRLGCARGAHRPAPPDPWPHDPDAYLDHLVADCLAR